jgi:hypothetical protein
VFHGITADLESVERLHDFFPDDSSSHALRFLSLL